MILYLIMIDNTSLFDFMNNYLLVNRFNNNLVIHYNTYYDTYLNIDIQLTIDHLLYQLFNNRRLTDNCYNKIINILSKHDSKYYEKYFINGIAKSKEFVILLKHINELNEQKIFKNVNCDITNY